MPARPDFCVCPPAGCLTDPDDPDSIVCPDYGCGVCLYGPVSSFGHPVTGPVAGRTAVALLTALPPELVAAEPDEPWLLWCGLNDEADRLARTIPDAVNVHGSMSPEEKAELLLAFADGEITRLVTKASIAGLGLNWQHCARMAFVGLNDSYETYYQAIRRCYRYGQTRPVRAHVVLSELESAIAANVARKERQAARFTGQLVDAMRAAGHWRAAA